MKKRYIGLLCILVTALIALNSYSRIYRIADDKEQLADSIYEHSVGKSNVSGSIDIKQQLNIDNKKYILFTIKATLGDAELTKGFNNKYKIYYTQFGRNNLRWQVHETNKGKYFILKGKNLNGNIAYAKMLLENKEYKISIPSQEYFLTYCKVPIETESVVPEVNNLKFYNKNHEDITYESLRWVSVMLITFLKVCHKSIWRR